MSKYERFIESITVLSNEKADNVLINHTLQAMNNKLGKKRGEGRCGWWECSKAELWEMVDDHIQRAKNDPHQLIDTINLLAMINFLSYMEQKELEKQDE